MAATVPAAALMVRVRDGRPQACHPMPLGRASSPQRLRIARVTPRQRRPGPHASGRTTRSTTTDGPTRARHQARTGLRARQDASVDIELRVAGELDRPRAGRAARRGVRPSGHADPAGGSASPTAASRGSPRGSTAGWWGSCNVIGDGGAHAILLDTCVAPDVQGRGTGRALVAAAAAEARRAGCQWLHADYEPHLVDFYERACGRGTARWSAAPRPPGRRRGCGAPFPRRATLTTTWLARRAVEGPPVEQDVGPRGRALAVLTLACRPGDRHDLRAACHGAARDGPPICRGGRRSRADSPAPRRSSRPRRGCPAGCPRGLPPRRDGSHPATSARRGLPDIARAIQVRGTRGRAGVDRATDAVGRTCAGATIVIDPESWTQLHSARVEPVTRPWSAALVVGTSGPPWVTARREGRLVGFVNVVGDGGVHAILLDTVAPDAQRASAGVRSSARRLAPRRGARTPAATWLLRATTSHGTWSPSTRARAACGTARPG